jgi:NADP-dependent 3-hydroxy acid dehydrogenase YdfG
LNLAPGDWGRVLEVNIGGMVNVAQVLAPGMMERRAGTMVFLAIGGRADRVADGIRRIRRARRRISTLRSVWRRTWRQTRCG